jgi:hypothetical protein
MLGFFLVLGNIPGTDFFITFNEWLAVILTSAAVWFYFYHYYLLRQFYRYFRVHYLWMKLFFLQGHDRLTV